jgi:hypothetical protein
MAPETKIACTCRDWQENIDYLNAMLLLKWTHGGKGYEGKPFVYCPWCGTRIATAGQPDTELLANCRRQIEESFFSSGKWGQPELPNMLLAARPISQYRQQTGDLLGTLDLMLLFVETGTRFTLEYGDIDEPFYEGLEMMLEEFAELMLANPAFYEEADLALRLTKLSRDVAWIGWGYGDFVRDQVERVQETFGDI